MSERILIKCPLCEGENPKRCPECHGAGQLTLHFGDYEGELWGYAEEGMLIGTFADVADSRRGLWQSVRAVDPRRWEDYHILTALGVQL